MPVIDQVAREQVSSQFAGQYVSQDGTNSSLTLIVDQGPGVRVDQFVARGAPFLDVLGGLPIVGGASGRASLRLYPTSLTSSASSRSPWSTMMTNLTSDTTGVRTSFRAVVWAEPSGNQTQSPLTRCGAWGAVDGLVYGSQSLDEFIFELGSDGNAKHVEAPAWRVIMNKQS